MKLIEFAVAVATIMVLVTTCMSKDEYYGIPDATPGGLFVSSIIKNVSNELVTVDLGDGYTLSFELEETDKSPYDVVVYKPENIRGDWTRYFVNIYKNKTTGWFSSIHYGVIDISLQVADYGPSPRPVEIPITGMEYPKPDEKFGRITKTEQMNIDNWPGYVRYEWDNEESDLNLENAEVTEFQYYPYAIQTSEGLKSAMIVRVMDYAVGGVGDLSLFNGILKSIHLETPTSNDS